MKKVMVLEDESSIRSFIVINLRRAGYEVIEAETGEEALEKLQQNHDIRVALLDIMLPGIDGFEVCRRIRATNAQIGIIMLTARSQEMDKVTGLMTGADDYVTKPFSPAELTARVDALMRRSGGASEESSGEISQPPFLLNTRNRTLEKNGQRIKLTQVEYSIMRMFMENPGKALSREEILDMVWGRNYFGELKIVDVNIRRLRLKIEDNGKTTDLGFQLGADFNDPQWDVLLDELTVDEMENMYINAYGGLAELKSVGKAKSKDADGPAQIGGFTGMGAGTGFPSSSTLAQTWNAELAQEEGRTIGTQALQNGYTGWYAPATNMHRSPFNGRNYEYYSEDSLLSGVICGNTVQGANQAGVYTYVKHFICNDGESGIYRDSVYTWMTEQALRETYLRPFQMLVEDYDAVGLMSSYNRIGAVWAGGSKALLTGILRDEWGFDGAVITDYCDHHSYMNGDQALRAGGSLWMAGFIGGEMAFETGSNSYLQALRRAAKETLYMYLHVRVTNRDYAESIGDTTAVRHAFTTSMFGWRHLVALIDIVAVVLFVLAVRGVVIDVKLHKAAKSKNGNA